MKHVSEKRDLRGLYSYNYTDLPRFLSSDRGQLFLRNPTGYVSIPSPDDRNRSSFQNAVFFYFSGIPDDGQTPKSL
jgi:hypothetical protein